MVQQSMIIAMTADAEWKPKARRMITRALVSSSRHGRRADSRAKRYDPSVRGRARLTGRPADRAGLQARHRGLLPLRPRVAVALLVPVGATGQPQPAASDNWAPSRTMWGDPDLQGDWSFATITPLERPAQFSGRELLTEEEVAALNLGALTRGDELPPPGDPGAYNAFWFDRGESTRRKALIVDPPDGRIPFKAEGRHGRDARRFTRVDANTLEGSVATFGITRESPLGGPRYTANPNTLWIRRV